MPNNEPTPIKPPDGLAPRPVPQRPFPSPKSSIIPPARPSSLPAAVPPPPGIASAQSADDDGSIDLFALAQVKTSRSMALEELRLGPDPTCFGVFMTRGVPDLLHYEEHESLRGFHRCLVDNCPPCQVGRKPTEVILIPVYSYRDKIIAFLRAATAEGPHRLWSLLRPHIGQPGTADSFFEARREGNRFFLTVKPLLPGADRGTSQIRAFIADWKAGRVDLKSAYPTPSRADLQQVPAIHSYLALNGLLPTEAPGGALDATIDDDLFGSADDEDGDVL